MGGRGEMGASLQWRGLGVTGERVAGEEYITM